jgi:YHS domain-containing protein
MKSRILLGLVALGVVMSYGVGRLALAEEKTEFKATCPMSGGPAKEDNFVEVSGKKVYFCCKNCPKAFEKDPKAVAAKVHYQWLETGQIAQVGCPMSGGPVKEGTEVALGNVKFGFCCNNCKGKFEKASDEEKLAMIFGKIDKGFTLQTACPVSGKPINVAKHVEHEGKKVYFCCDGCPGAFQKDPAKFTAKLPQLTETK